MERPPPTQRTNPLRASIAPLRHSPPLRSSPAFKAKPLRRWLVDWVGLLGLVDWGLVVDAWSFVLVGWVNRLESCFVGWLVGLLFSWFE